MLNLLAALRQTTGEQHEEIHRHPLMRACMEQTLDREGYGQMLLAFSAPWQALTPYINSAAPAPIKQPLNMRAQALHADLSALTLMAQAPKPTEKFDTPARSLGAAYVLIGSSLGATTLTKQLQQQPPLPLNYLSISPKQAGWPLLLAELEKAPTHVYSEACVAAQQAFSMIQQGLNTV